MSLIILSTCCFAFLEEFSARFELVTGNQTCRFVHLDSYNGTQ